MPLSFSTQVARLPAWLSPERDPSTSTGKRRVVILGTGWAAHAIAKIIDINKVEIRVISPRNYFVLWQKCSEVLEVEIHPQQNSERIESYMELLILSSSICVSFIFILYIFKI